MIYIHCQKSDLLAVGQRREGRCQATSGAPLVLVPWGGTLVVWAWGMVASEGGGVGDRHMVLDQEVVVVACMALDSMASLERAGDREIHIESEVYMLPQQKP